MREREKSVINSVQLSAFVMTFQVLFNCNKDHDGIRFWFHKNEDFELN